MRVQANPRALAAYGLNIDDLRTTLANANVNTPKGNFDGPTRAYTINANDQLQSADDYTNLVIAYRTARRCGSPTSPTSIDGAENTKLGGLDEHDAGGHPQHPAPARRQRHRGGRPHQGAAAAAAGGAAGRGRCHGADRPHRRPSAPRSHDVEFELALAVVLVVLVIFVFLRSVRGDHHPEPVGAAVAGRHAWR